jgi:hypothetical protein
MQMQHSVTEASLGSLAFGFIAERRARRADLSLSRIKRCKKNYLSRESITIFTFEAATLAYPCP